ncbi:MgtC/SapB family protein [Gordonia sp. TBRC 11910]|uniref:MgtC/SapB family protein n=1 Tax=Gordonia asplenii TaxID=2725283 RepID=A0A848KQP8_9ACTN|nr:MgtC/SapB family protein [Gordonia asplenii]NMO01026.1 MgtC/SapB family protein [Gordonia asplenii]
MTPWEVAIRIGAGLLFGAAIGFERQWRSRSAGLRTNALVSLGSALFVVLGAYSFAGHGDPTRVAAQIVSGIGFLGAGVIMKQGSTVSGLNTAATLWASAAVGALAGGGMLWVSLAGAGTIIAANMILRPMGRLLDRQHRESREDSPAEYIFEVRCPTDAEADIRRLVFDALSRPDLTVQSIAARDLPDDEGVRITVTALTDERDDREIEAAIADVIVAPAITEVRWSVADLSGID